MNKSVQYIFCDGYFGGIHFYLFLNNKILNLQPIEADGYKKLLITMQILLERYAYSEISGTSILI